MTFCCTWLWTVKVKRVGYLTENLEVCSLSPAALHLTAYYGCSFLFHYCLQYFKLMHCQKMPKLNCLLDWILNISPTVIRESVSLAIFESWGIQIPIMQGIGMLFGFCSGLETRVHIPPHPNYTHYPDSQSSLCRTVFRDRRVIFMNITQCQHLVSQTHFSHITRLHTSAISGHKSLINTNQNFGQLHDNFIKHECTLCCALLTCSKQACNS